MHLTPKYMWQISAPHTWPASVLPPFVALCAAKAQGFEVSIPMAILLLVICVLLQSAVNSINDYFDCVKGSDSEEDNVEIDDAVLIYNDINPKEALYFSLGLIMCALLLGIPCILEAGITPLIIALIGVTCVFLYSGGHTPISYLPIGEIVSGFVMGGLIPLACYDVLTNQLNFMVLVWSIPTIVAIALIMFTNNTCDIEKDIKAKRSTLSVLIKRNNARRLYHALMILGVVSATINILIFFTNGWIVCLFGFLAGIGAFKALWNNPLVSNSRIAAMGQVCTYTVVLGAFYAAAIAF
jgi:1,4-dihydroxy-2-naphthoate octaprenyltransferase